MILYHDVLCVIHNGIEAMCYGKNSTILKLAADGILDQGVCLKVQCSCSLIQHQNFSLSKKSSC